MTDLAADVSQLDAADTDELLSAARFRRRGAQPALIPASPDDATEHSAAITYGELADRIELRRIQLGRTRRLVMLCGADGIEAIVTLLAALDGDHPLIVTDGGRHEEHLISRYRPDTIVRTGATTVDAEILHSTTWGSPSSHQLHPDLALLMSTSGTTGGAKLVRLSREALCSNAIAIGQALGLSSDDRAITSLPMHYCFGLSVVTSHLAAGASVVVSDASVVDPCFWKSVDRWGVTTLAGVPFTFEMIERAGLDVMRCPSLRLVTQAGGRMEPDARQRFVDTGSRFGWDFVVMYGQTEATARMAVSSPADMRANPAAVGRAIPGGSFRIEPHADTSQPGAGEVLYTGPNVMMGYAHAAEDLRAGREVVELRTGDLGRLDDAGRLEIIGRVSRFVKLHGKRIELDHLEKRLSHAASRVRCVGDDDMLLQAAYFWHVTIPML